MHVENVVQKFGLDDFLAQSWALPDSLSPALRGLVNLTDEGWVLDEWLVTPEIAAVVQPYVDEPIDPESGFWYLGAWQTD